MKDDIFEWDDVKAATNISKHGVSFEEARTVFEDAFAMTIRDVEHSLHEVRYATVGVSLVSRVLLVIHAERRERIRIISARKATPSERREYEAQYQ